MRALIDWMADRRGWVETKHWILELEIEENVGKEVA